MKFNSKYKGHCTCGLTQILNFCDKCQLQEWEASQSYALRRLSNAFAIEMKHKLLKKMRRGRGGWDNAECFTLEQIKQQIIDHIEKGDFVDVANLAAFAWNRDTHSNQQFNIGDQVRATDSNDRSIDTVFTITSISTNATPYHIRSVSGLVGGDFKASSLKLIKKAQQ